MSGDLQRAGTSGQAAMLWAAVLVLGLAAPCRALVAPPTLNISLDAAPEERWLPLLAVFETDYLKRAAAEIIE